MLSVFNYASAKGFFSDWVQDRQREDRDFSIRSWTKKTDFSHTLIVFLLQGKRPLRARHGLAFAQAMGLGSQERIYFQTLIELENAKSMEQRELISGWLRELHPGNKFTFKEVEEYKLFARWEHMAILAMLDLKDPPKNADEAYALFGGKNNPATSPQEVSAAWERLLDLGLMTESKSGKAPKPTFTEISCRDDISNKGAREYHRQIMELSKDAIESQALDEREFQSFTLGVTAADIPKIKDAIRCFRTKLTREYSKRGTAEEVYQTGFQFFRLTNNSVSKSKGDSREKN